MIISGSLLKSLQPEFYSRIIRKANERRMFTILKRRLIIIAEYMFRKSMNIDIWG